jgi:hypothetical protein
MLVRDRWSARFKPLVSPLVGRLNHWYRTTSVSLTFEFFRHGHQEFVPLRSGNARYVQCAAVGFRKARLVQVFVQRRPVGAVENDLQRLKKKLKKCIPFPHVHSCQEILQRSADFHYAICTAKRSGGKDDFTAKKIRADGIKSCRANTNRLRTSARTLF